MSVSETVKPLFASLCLTLIIYVAYQFVSLRSQNYVTSVARVDCLVVLGAAVWPGGRPSPVLSDRLLRAAQLYHQGVAGKIICSGGVGKYPPAEAEVGKQFLLKAGVAEQDILMEAGSYSTVEQAELIKEICDREGFNSIGLVTSFYHEKRAIRLFRDVGFTKIEDARCTHERFQDLNYWIARESLLLARQNWLSWGAIGAGIGVLALKYKRVRRRASEAGSV